MQSIAETLLSAPEEEVSDIAKMLIEKWSDPPLPVEIYETLRYCQHDNLASLFSIGVIEMYLESRCREESVLRKDIEIKSNWRD